MFVSVSREASECRLYANIARIRHGSNLTRSLVNASSKCSNAGSVWLAATNSRSDSKFLSAVEERNKEARLILVCQESE